MLVTGAKNRPPRQCSMTTPGAKRWPARQRRVKTHSNIQECQEHGNTDIKCPNQDNSVNYACDLELTDLNHGSELRTDETKGDELSEGVSSTGGSGLVRAL